MVEAGFQKVRSENRESESAEASCQGDIRSAPENQPGDVGSISPEGHSHAELAGALGDKVGDDSENADGSQNQSDDSKAAEEDNCESPLRDGIGDELFESGGVVYGQVFIY